MTYKGYLITPDKLFPNLYSIAVEGRGGKIPNVLSGRFTTYAVAMQNVDQYMTQQENTRVRKTNPAE